jgi:hypothetical protein
MTSKHGGAQINVKLHLAILRSTRTQSQLSVMTGIGETRLSRIVNGWIEAREDEKQRIAGAVGVPVAKLFDARDEDQPLEETA